MPNTLSGITPLLIFMFGYENSVWFEIIDMHERKIYLYKKGEIDHLSKYRARDIKQKQAEAIC